MKVEMQVPKQRSPRCRRLRRVGNFILSSAAISKRIWRLYYRYVFFASFAFMLIYFIPAISVTTIGNDRNPKTDVPKSSMINYIQIRLHRAVSVPEFGGRQQNTLENRILTLIVAIVLSGDSWLEYFYGAPVFVDNPAFIGVLNSTLNDVTGAGSTTSGMVKEKLKEVARTTANVWYGIVEKLWCVCMPCLCSIILAPIVAATDLVVCTYAIIAYEASANVANLFAAALISIILLSPFVTFKKQRQKSRRHAKSE